MTSIISRSLSLSTSCESKLPDFLKEFGESTDPHVLGAYFRVDSAILRKLEEDYQDDTRRQMGEVIKYLLLNRSLDPQLLWKTLMQAREAVQKIGSGGHAHLTNTLSGKYHGEIGAYEHTNDQRVIQALKCAAKKERKSTKESSVVLLDSTVKRNILIVGKNGEGKSTLGNRILKCRHFKINSTVLPQTQTGKSAVKSQSQLKTYKFKIFDHDGLFDMNTSTAMSSLFNTNDELHLNMVLFVMKQGHFFDRNVQQTLETIMTTWPDIGRISALVVTHCERLSEEERKEVVQKIKMMYPAIANFMKVRTITVGFPDQDYVRDEQSLADSTDRDTAKLRTLIYFSEGRVNISRSSLLKVPSEAKIQIAKGTSEAKPGPVITFRDMDRPPDQPCQSPLPGVFHSPPQPSALSPKQNDCKSSEPEQREMTDEATATTEPAYQADSRSVCEPNLSIHGNKGHKKGFRRNITSKISSLIKKFEISHSDHSSRSRNHPKLMVEESKTFTDGGKPLLPPNPGTASSHYTPFRRTPSPRPVTAEPHPPECGRSLHPAEQQPGYKTSPCLGRQLHPPAGCTSPKSEKIKQVQSEARQAHVKRTNTLPRNFERMDSLESSPRSKRKLFSRRKSVKDLRKMFEEKSKDVGHARVPETVRRKKPLSKESAVTNGAAKVAEIDQYEVKHHHLSLIEWKKSSVKDSAHKVAIYDTAESKWDKIAEHLGLKPSKIESIRQDRQGNHERVTAVFIEWLENANQLPNHKKYPLKWSGLIRLLRDSELGQLDEDLRCALAAPFSNVKGNLSY